MAGVVKFERIYPQQLMMWFQAGENVKVIDVRDDDYIGVSYIARNSAIFFLSFFLSCVHSPK